MFFKSGQLYENNSAEKDDANELFNFDIDEDETPDNFQGPQSETIKVQEDYHVIKIDHDSPQQAKGKQMTFQDFENRPDDFHRFNQSNQVVQREDSDDEDFKFNQQSVQEIEGQIESYRASKKKKSKVVQFTDPTRSNFKSIDYEKDRDLLRNKIKNRQIKLQQKLLDEYLPQIVDLRNFLNTAIPNNHLFQCTIVRHKGGLEYFYPRFNMYISETKQYLITAKKMSLQSTAYYLLSMDQTQLTRKSSSFLGKIRSNFLGTEYNVYDNGENPTKTTHLDKIRSQLGVVLYQSNFLSSNQPRRMSYILPELEFDQPVSYKSLNNESGLKREAQNQSKKIKILINKQPVWNQKMQAFVLPFTNRVTSPSVKNFQLIDPNDPENVILQFGRSGSNTFHLDFQHPLTPLQAFSICITTFDFKLASD